MKEFQERNTTKKRMYSKTTLVILSIVLILVVRGVYTVYAKEQDTEVEVQRAQKQKDDLQARFDSIQQDSEHLNTPQGVEAEIRSKFDVVKPGEGVIMVVDKDIPVIQEDNRGIIKKFWDSVMSVFKGSKKVE